MALLRRLDNLNPSPARWTDLGEWSMEQDRLCFFSTPGQNSQSGAELPIGSPSGPLQEAWLTYQVKFQAGFDFGLNQKAHSVGGKMPGLGSRGRHEIMNGNHTGGSHDPFGFSGRLMWRGVNTEGKSWLPADKFTLSLYAYHLGGRQHSFWFREEGKEVNPARHAFDGNNNGTGPGGIGNVDAWHLPLDEWITVTIGYGVGDGHWAEAWTSTESDPVAVRRLRLDTGWNWMAQDARQEIDTLLFQTHWGGNTLAWMPTTRSKLQYRAIEVHDSNPIVLPEQPQPPIIPPPVDQDALFIQLARTMGLRRAWGLMLDAFS